MPNEKYHFYLIRKDVQQNDEKVKNNLHKALKLYKLFTIILEYPSSIFIFEPKINWEQENLKIVGTVDAQPSTKGTENDFHAMARA